MKDRTRERWALALLVPLAALVGAAAVGLPAFGDYPGPYGDLINAVALPERQILNAITAVNFDYRGFDTLGEEFILFTGVAALAVLLAPEGPDADEDATATPARPPRIMGPAVRLAGLVLAPITLLVACYVIVHPHLSPGGGFQGGVLLATAFLLVYLCFDRVRFRALSPPAVLEALEALGVGGYVLAGALALAAGGAFLQNLLPLGEAGKLFSSGNVLVLNACTALAVAAGIQGACEAFVAALRIDDREDP